MTQIGSKLANSVRRAKDKQANETEATSGSAAPSVKTSPPAATPTKRKATPTQAEAKTPGEPQLLFRARRVWPD